LDRLQGAALGRGAGKLVSVAGGGDTVAALNAAGVTGRFSCVSTARGTFLKWLDGKALPWRRNSENQKLIKMEASAPSCMTEKCGG
jgi:3-phosphoglycerate kinase